MRWAGSQVGAGEMKLLFIVTVYGICAVGALDGWVAALLLGGLLGLLLVVVLLLLLGM
jgi:hypothetical protein